MVTHFVRSRPAVATHDLLSQVRLAVAAADALEKVLGERVQSGVTLRSRYTRIKLESFKAGHDFDFRDVKSPDREAGQEDVELLCRPEARWGCCSSQVRQSCTIVQSHNSKVLTCTTVLEYGEQPGEQVGPQLLDARQRTEFGAIQHVVAQRFGRSGDQRLQPREARKPDKVVTGSLGMRVEPESSSGLLFDDQGRQSSRDGR